jgi:hypothetical protein
LDEIYYFFRIISSEYGRAQKLTHSKLKSICRWLPRGPVDANGGLF